MAVVDGMYAEQSQGVGRISGDARVFLESKVIHRCPGAHLSVWSSRNWSVLLERP